MNIEFNELFSSPKIKEKLSSEQFKLSEILLDKRYELNLSFAKISEIVGLSKDEYIKYEYGNTDIPVEDYYRAIKRIETYERHLSQVNITFDKNQYFLNNSQSLNYDSSDKSGNFELEVQFIVEAA